MSIVLMCKLLSLTLLILYILSLVIRKKPQLDASRFVFACRRVKICAPAFRENDERVPMREILS